MLLTTEKVKAERILKADLGRVKYYIQTLEYDRDTGNIWCAARKGDEYSLFLIDGKSDNDKLNLIHDNGKSGWDCEQASDGFCSLGYNRYYILIPDYSKRESQSLEKGQGILVYFEQLESITEKQDEKYW